MKKAWLALLISALALFSACDASIVSSSQSTSDSQNASDSQSNSSAPTSEEHVDDNNDGVCDDCRESVLATFDFFAVNDLHGKLTDTDTQPGVDELSTYLKNAKSANENTLVFSSGDMWQGASESNLTKGLIMTDWMNELNFVSMTMGNHEYDWGEEYITENLELADFPFLALNIFDRTTNERVSYCEPSVLVEQNGVKIGIIGAIGDCYTSIASERVQNVYFKVGSELTALVKAESQKLRAAGADFIVYSVHDDYSNYDSSLSNGYVDLVFEGHSHQGYVKQDGYGVYHLQGGGDNSGITHARATINFANEQGNVTSANFVRTSEYDALQDDPIVETLLEKYGEEIAIAGKFLGYNDYFRNADYLCDTVAKLYYEEGLKLWGDEYEIVLGGAYLKARSPYELSAGEVIYADVQSLFPFDNELVLCSVSGYYLLNKFFETRNQDYYIAYGDYGAEVWANIDYNETYYLVTDTYTSTYAPNHLTEIARYNEQIYARDLLAKHIEMGGMSATNELLLTSIPEILALGATLDINEETTEEYLVKGRIVSVHSTTWGNMTIEDENGNRLYIYGVYDATGMNRYDVMSTQPKAGDTVTLQGIIKRYLNDKTGEEILEMVNGKTKSIEQDIE